jgi:fatty acid desaturase 2 (delta-6 desaturase)
VYDISNWTRKHPGGKVIDFCSGRDATEAFYAFHPHDLRSVRKYLPPLCIGQLSDPNPSSVMKDFRELRRELEREGRFRPSVTFYTFCYVQIILLELLGVYIMETLVPFNKTLAILVCGMILATSQIQAGWLQHDFGHLAVFPTAYINTLFHNITIGLLKGASSKVLFLYVSFH